LNLHTSFTLNTLRRDWRNAEVRLLFLALVVAVASLTAVSFFTNRIQQAMNFQATELLAADLVLSSRYELPPDLQQQVQNAGLQQAKTLSFRSMAVSEEDFVLVQLKAVNSAYPLRGTLRISETPLGEEYPTEQTPAQSKIWVEDRLLYRLNKQVGDNIQLGSQHFEIAQVLRYEPDRGGSLIQLAPRVMMNLDDVAATGLVAPGSRVQHRLLLAGEVDQVKTLRQQLEQQAERAGAANQWDIQGVEDARPELRSALTQAERFLSLAALVAVILAGAAIAVAARQFALRQADAAAIMRCLGATQDFINRLYLFRLLALGLIASSVGCAVGYLLHLGLSKLLTAFFVTELPSPDASPILLGLVTGLLTLFSFAWPAVLRLRSIPPLRVLRRDLGLPPPSVWQVLLLASLGMGALLWWLAGEIKLAGFMLGGVAALLLLLLTAAYVLVKALSFFRYHSQAAWRFGLANLARRAQSSSVQLAGFGLGIMALLLLAIVRVDLLGSWQTTLDENTPNHFLLNIQPHEVNTVQQRFTDIGIQTELYPMIPGNLLRINGRAVSVDDYDNPRAKRLASRAFNLSWSATLPDNNTLQEGEWWDENRRGVASIESGIAETLGIKLGDELTYRIGAQEISVKIANLREVDWDSFQVNFFVVTSPDVLASVPTTSICSFHLPDSQTRWLLELVRDFPAITVLNVGALLKQVKSIMERASLAIEYVFMLTLLAGLLVLYAAIQASHEERLQEAAILRTLGAGRKHIIVGLLTEFVTLGLLAGLLAASMASFLGFALSTWVFDLPYQFNMGVWLIGLMGGAVGVGIAGLLGTQHVLKQPPAEVLRRLAG